MCFVRVRVRVCGLPQKCAFDDKMSPRARHPHNASCWLADIIEFYTMGVRAYVMLGCDCELVHMNKLALNPNVRFMLIVVIRANKHAP